MSQLPPYFKRDLKILLVLILFMAGLIVCLWYFEDRQQFFTRLAQELLDF